MPALLTSRSSRPYSSATEAMTAQGLCAIAHVQLPELDLGAGRAPGAETGRHHPPALAGKPSRHPPADAPLTAGDDRDAAGRRQDLVVFDAGHAQSPSCP